MIKNTILYIGGFKLPDKNAAAHRVLNNGKAISSLGYSVVFFGIDDYDSDISFIRGNNGFMGYECWSRSYPKNHRDWCYYLTNIDFITFFLEKYQNITAIIAYNYPAIALWKIDVFCRKRNIKVIGDCTEWYDTKGSSLLFKLIKGFDTFLRMRVLHKNLDALIVISKYLERYYHHCANVIRIPPLVDVDEEKWSFSYSINRFPRQINEILFVYSGSPGRKKDKLDVIIKSLSLLDIIYNYSFVIIGIDKKEFLSNYPSFNLILDELRDKVVFLGRLPHEECVGWLKKANYSIFYREKSRVTLAGFPTKFVESITCSTPVITSDSSDLKEYIQNSSYGILVSNYGPKVLTQVLESVLKTRTNNLTNQNSLDNSLFHYENYLSLFKKMLNKLFQA